MPFRPNIEVIPNDPLGFMPFEDFGKTDFETFRKSCGEHDEGYCRKVYFTDLPNWQFRPAMIPGQIMNTDAKYLGTTTATTAGKCEAPGIGTAANVGSLIYNAATGASTYVTSIDSANVVSVNDDIFVSGQVVNLFSYTTTGGWNVTNLPTYGLAFCRPSAASLNSISLPLSISPNTAYYVAVYVRNYQGGELTVKLGTNSVGTLSANGLHEFYGVSNGTSITFESSSAQNFIGCLEVDRFDGYELLTNYTISILSGDLTGLFSFPLTLSSFNADALKSGVLTIDDPAQYSYLFTECQCFYSSLQRAYPCTELNIIKNGTFESFFGWESSDQATIGRNATNNTLKFKAAANGEYAEYVGEFNCPPLCGVEYEIQFLVTEYSGGDIVIDVFGEQQGVNITGTGNYSIEVTTPENCTGVFKLIASGTTTLELDNLTVKYTKPQYEDLAVTEKLCVCTPDECEVTISYRNDVNAFGFEYEHDSDFRNTINVCGKLRNSRVRDTDLIVNRDTFGTTEAVYSKLDNLQEFVTGLIPPYLANAIHVALRHSDVVIAGKRYVCIDSFEQQTSEDSGLQKITALLAPYQQPFRNGYRK